MKRRHLSIRPVFLISLLILALAAAASLALASKKPLSYDAYDGWRSIQGTQISRDGQWLVYALVPEDGDGELVALNLKTNKEYRSPRGKQPVITVDGKFVAFTISPLKAEVDKAKKDKKKPEEQPKSGLGIMNLYSGEVSTVERVKSFKLPEESGAAIAYLLESPLKSAEEKKADEKKEEAKKEETKKAEPKKEEGKDEKKEEKKKEPGTDLIVRELGTGKETKVTEVVEYAWPKNGAWLAYGVSSKTPENDGAFARETATGKTVTLLKGLGNYKGFAFDEKGSQSAFTSDRDDYKSDKSASKLYYWAPTAAAAVELVPAQANNFPAGMAVSENGKLTFSKDGGRLFFGIATAPKQEPKDAPEPVKVDIWSWKDPYLQTMQKVQADDEKKRSLMCVMHFSPKGKKFVQLATEEMPDITLSEDAKLAVGSSNLPYRQLSSWDQSYEDIFLVSLADGARKKVLEKSRYGATISPGGNYLLYFNDGDRNYYAYRVLDGKTFNLTGKLGVGFVDETWDMPSDPGPCGTGGWTEGDKSVLIYDRYDIWEIVPDGSKARMITNGVGRRDKLVFRYQNLDPDRKTVPAKEPIVLTATNDLTKASGAYGVTLANPADPAKVIMLDKLFDDLLKAKNADVYAFTWQRFDEFPNLWVSDANFAGARKVSDANPQQAEYNWGKAELINYLNFS